MSNHNKIGPALTISQHKNILTPTSKEIFYTASQLCSHHSPPKAEVKSDFWQSVYSIFPRPGRVITIKHNNGF